MGILAPNTPGFLEGIFGIGAAGGEYFHMKGMKEMGSDEKQVSMFRSITDSRLRI